MSAVLKQTAATAFKPLTAEQITAFKQDLAQNGETVSGFVRANDLDDNATRSLLKQQAQGRYGLSFKSYQKVAARLARIEQAEASL